jgi:hypothetical protein
MDFSFLKESKTETLAFVIEVSVFLLFPPLFFPKGEAADPKDFLPLVADPKDFLPLVADPKDFLVDFFLLFLLGFPRCAVLKVLEQSVIYLALFYS